VAGLAAARRRGRRGGRPSAIDAERLAAMVAAFDGGVTKTAVCRTFGIKRCTLIDSLARIGWSAGLKVQGEIRSNFVGAQLRSEHVLMAHTFGVAGGGRLKYPRRAASGGTATR
jgi:hypothetical protein